MIVTSGSSKSVYKYSETFTTVSTGAATDLLGAYTSFSLLVVKTGAVLTWNVKLTGSIDGTNFTDIVTHTDILGTGKLSFGGSSYPCTHLQINVTALALGTGTNIIVTALGVS